MRKYFLAASLFLFALLSLTTLRSIVPDLLYKQALSFGLAFILFALAAKLPFNLHLQLSKWFYLGLNLLLLGLLIYGSVTRGISAWVTLPFGFKFQPSQFAVPVVALYLANFFAKEKHFSWASLGQALAIIVLPFALILAQPDFGTALVFLAAMSVFLLFNRLSWQQFLALFGAAVFSLALLWTVVFKDYQRSRILGFLHLQQSQAQQQNVQTESSSAYNARQALIAVGGGQFWGRGIGQGVQSHLRFLPERQTDFIFASFVEEWGFLGALFLLSLYFALLLFLWRFVAYAPNFRAQLYILVILVMFLVQIFINVGMNMAILPITGITLPFLSYGGSSVLALFYALGVVQSIVATLPKKATWSFY
jgi:rod shape determining protein RodA